MEEGLLEERFANARNGLFQALFCAESFNFEILKGFHSIFKEEPDYTKHGPVLWAIMFKSTQVKRGVLGKHFQVYMQYYYHYLVMASQRRECKRSLDTTSLAFITTAAAFGYARGTQEFDAALQAKNMDPINNLIVDHVNFRTFFWTGSDDTFSWCGAWKLIDGLWDLWDVKEPIKIHGFVSGNLSFEMLKTHSKDLGTFCFRFSSQGGIAVDYIGRGQLMKSHWKHGAIKDSLAFLRLMYDPKEGDNLRFLIDVAGGTPRIHQKTDAFPTGGKLNAGYTGAAGGYQTVHEGDPEDKMTDVSSDNFLANFVQGSWH